MPTKHDLEHLLNGQLADLLVDAGIPAQAEVKQGNRRLDALADMDGLPDSDLRWPLRSANDPTPALDDVVRHHALAVNVASR